MANMNKISFNFWLLSESLVICENSWSLKSPIFCNCILYQMVQTIFVYINNIRIINNFSTLLLIFSHSDSLGNNSLLITNSRIAPYSIGIVSRRVHTLRMLHQNITTPHRWGMHPMLRNIAIDKFP